MRDYIVTASAFTQARKKRPAAKQVKRGRRCDKRRIVQTKMRQNGVKLP